MRLVLRLLRRRLFWILLFPSMILSGLLFGGLCLFVLSQFDGNAELPVDCGIVFGTGVRVQRDERGAIVYTGPGPGISRRVDAAAELYRQGSLRRLFLSGGRGEGMVESEAEVMRRLAVVKGVRNEDIVIEEQSTSTMENLTFTGPMMKDCTSIVGISDRYHLARIRVIAWLKGVSLQTAPASRHATRAFELWSVAREAAGIVLAFFGY